MDECTELWLPVVGYEDAYEVSDFGRVRSKDRVVCRGRRGSYVRTGCILAALAAPRTGHLRVPLTRDGVTRRFMVHRLTLTAHVGPPPSSKPDCRHLDGNTAHNHVGNLRWGTKSENGQDSVRHGTHPEVAKDRCPQGHLYAGPNLVQRGQGRRCRACVTSQVTKCKKRDSDPTFDWKTHADRNYERLMTDWLAANPAA